MTSLQSLPSELLLHIAWSTTSSKTLGRLARTCHRIHEIAAHVLHRRATQETQELEWAVGNDKADVFRRVFAHQLSPQWVVSSHALNIRLVEALRAGSFRVANVLLDAGAEVVYTADSRQVPNGSETEIWLGPGSDSDLGALAVAAGSRYRSTGEKESLTQGLYSSEMEFWKWKKRAMQKILHQLRLGFLRDCELNPGASFVEYQRELDFALVEAATTDAQSVEVMEFLAAAGADVNAAADSQAAGRAWRNALNEERPCILRAKVEFLVQRGVDMTNVYSWEGPQTPVQFFLTKLHRRCQYPNGTSFLPKAFQLIGVLESMQCLQWPRLTFKSGSESPEKLSIVFADMNEPGVWELGLIASDEGPSLRPLRKALWLHLTSHISQEPAEKRDSLHSWRASGNPGGNRMRWMSAAEIS